MTDNAAATLQRTLFERFGEDLVVPPNLSGLDELLKTANHRTHRQYLPRPIDRELVRLLCACGLSAPTKSDLQQCDIIIVSDAAKQRAIAAKISDMPQIADAPAFLVFAGNGNRLETLSKLRSKPFPNDHLDLFFNVVVDAALVLATFVHAAEAVGLGCCPISAIRDHCWFVSDLLKLPDKVVPVAGLCLGWPAQVDEINPRLSLGTTVIENIYDERDIAAQIDDYDRRRIKSRPYRKQRHLESWGQASTYGRSEDKARQYAEPTRIDFGTFVREIGFRLD
jgi:nitroreductase